MKFWILFPPLLLLPLALPAQPTDEDEPPTVEITIKTMAIGRGDFDGVLLQAEEDADPVALSFSRYRRSDPVEYKGTVPLVFFRQTPNPNPEEPPVRTPVATYSMNPDNPVEDLLLFFLPLPEPDPATGFPFKVFGMDDSLAAFPRDSAIIFNATGALLYGRVNGDEQVFRAGASQAFPLGRDFDAAFAVETRDGPKLVFENVLQFSEDLRAIVMLRPPNRARSIRIVSYNIIERLDPALTEE